MKKKPAYQLISTVLRKTAFIFLLLFVTLLIAEILFGIYFSIKDSRYHPIETADYPYTYFVQNDTDTEAEHRLKTPYDFEKPEGVYRVLLTGGSVARAGRVGETVSGFMESGLKEAFPEMDFQVVNAGVSAYNKNQEFIFYHTTLKYFEPDFVVSLSGYNDLLSWYFNRFEEQIYVQYPHHWKHFKFNKSAHDFTERLSALFKSLSRAIDFVQRSRQESSRPIHQTSESERKVVAQNFLSAAHDFQLLLDGHGADGYLLFLQPVRFSGMPLEELNNMNSQFLQIYNQILQLSESIDVDLIDLSGMFNENRAIFTDDCHVNAEGNRLIAEQINNYIIDFLQSDFAAKPFTD